MTTILPRLHVQYSILDLVGRSPHVLKSRSGLLDLNPEREIRQTRKHIGRQRTRHNNKDTNHLGRITYARPEIN